MAHVRAPAGDNAPCFIEQFAIAQPRNAVVLHVGIDLPDGQDKAALEKFGKGKMLTVRYVLSDKASADIPIRLEGLADAIASLSR